MSVIGFNIWGIEWVKNEGKQEDINKKAQNVAIKSCPKQEITITSYTQIKRNNGNIDRRLWAHVSPNQLIKLVKQNRGVYEIIIEDRKRKVYFDIDGHQDDTILDKAIQIIKQYFPDDIELNISGNKQNNSYHIVLNNYYFKNIKDQQKLKRLMDIHNDIFDNKVYTKNRLMKCVNQSKPESYVQKIISGSKKIKDHLITCGFPLNSKNAFDVLPDTPIDQKTYKGKWEANNIKQLNLKIPVKDFEFWDATPFEILKIIPNPIRTDPNCLTHVDTWCVANFAKYNCITFEQFWSWCKNKDDSKERANKWFHTHWNNTLENCKFKYGYNEISRFLERFYPDILKNNDQHKFKQYHAITGTKIINNQYLSVNDFTDKQVQLLALGLGANKTGSMIDYLKQNESKSFILMTPRVTLGHNILGRMKQISLPYTFYKDKEFNSTKKKREGLPNSNNLVIQINSLHYLLNRATPYDIVVIDEIESVLNLWIENITLSAEGHLIPCWQAFIKILREAKKLILIDALLSKKTLKFLESIGIKSENIEIIKRSFEPKPRDLIVLPKDYEICHFIQDITKDLCNGKKLFVFYPFVNRCGDSKNPAMTEMVDLISTKYQQTTGKELQFKIYVGATDDKDKKQLSDVNTVWDDQDLIICNQAITVGVNYDRQQFDSCYIAYASFNKPRDLVQVSMRVRTLNDNTVKIYRMKSKPFAKKDFKVGTIIDKNHKSLVNDIVLEEKNKTAVILYHLFKLANYKVKQDKTTKTEMDDVFFFDYDELLKQSYTKFTFEKIEDITYNEAEQIYERMWYNDATFDDKMKLYKYKFKELFIYDIEPNIISWLWTDRNNIQKYSEFLDTDWGQLLLKELNLTKLIIPNNFNKLSNELRSKIFKEFKFDRLNRDCGDKMLISRALNAFFKPADIYYWNCESGDTKNGIYTMCFAFHMGTVEICHKYLSRFHQEDTFLSNGVPTSMAFSEV